MAEVSIFFADGFEEIEGLTVVDILRRGGVSIQTVSMGDSKIITSSHKVPIVCDVMFDEADFEDGKMLVLPGGMPGTNNLMASEKLEKLLKKYHDDDKFLAAICAAPSVLGMKGLLEGRMATCFPGFGDKLIGADYHPELKTVVDGKIITASGMGPAIDFSLAILEALTDKENAEKIGKAIQYL